VPATPIIKPPAPTEAELRMRAVIRTFAAQYHLAERGQPVGEVRMNQLAHRLAAVACPEGRPVDREQPRVPRGAAARNAAIKARTPEPVAPKPAPVRKPRPKPSLPLPGQLEADALQVLRLIASENASNVVIAHRLRIPESRVKYLVRRLKQLLGAETRAGLAGAAESAGLLGEVLPVAILVPARPSAASNPPERGPGGSSAAAGRTGPFVASAPAPASTVPSAPQIGPQTAVQGPGQVQP
jgi:DNA-binding CsgD family transcriptional regulator